MTIAQMNAFSKASRSVRNYELREAIIAACAPNMKPDALKKLLKELE